LVKGAKPIMAFKKNATIGSKMFDIFNYLLITLITLATVFPLINFLSLSLSSSRAISSGEVFILPVEVNFGAYINLIKDGTLVKALKNSVVVAGCGTALNMVATILGAYPLSKKRLRGRGILLGLITFTMMFGGGLIPTFILIKQLNLIDSYWSLWLLGLISTYNMLVLKSFFEQLPPDLEESAAIDGFNDFSILVRIILPISMPAIATITLFYLVSHWNSYFNVMMYISDSNKQTVMTRLMQMIDKLKTSLLDSSELQIEMAAPESVKAAAVVFSTLPILCVYPFLQRYFVKGVMIGAIKS